jgi:hypothetical protein
MRRDNHLPSHTFFDNEERFTRRYFQVKAFQHQTLAVLVGDVKRYAMAVSLKTGSRLTFH